MRIPGLIVKNMLEVPPLRKKKKLAEPKGRRRRIHEGYRVSKDLGRIEVCPQKGKFSYFGPSHELGKDEEYGRGGRGGRQ